MLTSHPKAPAHENLDTDILNMLVFYPPIRLAMNLPNLLILDVSPIARWHYVGHVYAYVLGRGGFIFSPKPQIDMIW